MPSDLSDPSALLSRGVRSILVRYASDGFALTKLAVLDEEIAPSWSKAICAQKGVASESVKFGDGLAHGISGEIGATWHLSHWHKKSVRLPAKSGYVWL